MIIIAVTFAIPTKRTFFKHQKNIDPPKQMKTISSNVLFVLS